MVNSQIIAEVVNTLKLDVQKDVVPSPVPIVDVGLKSSISPLVKTTTQSTTGNVSLISSTDYPDNYVHIKAAYLSFAKNATCDIATGAITLVGTVNGTTRNIIALAVLTTTAERDSVYISFDTPIRIDKGTTVYYTGTFTAGALTRSGGICFVVEEII